MKFVYLEPDSIKSAIRLLENYRERGKILAGGTDLLVHLKRGVIRPDFVIHIGLIKDLEGITIGNEGVQIGSLMTMRTIEKSEQLRGAYDILRQGVAQVSSQQIRNVATLGGNLCNGIPSADSVPPLIALDAVAVVEGPKGQRIIPVEEFHIGPGKTVLGPDELLVGFKIPPQPPHTGGAYTKYTFRGTFELAIVGIAVLLTLSPFDLTCKKARIAIGACGPVPIRARKAELSLIGNKIDEHFIDEAARIAAEEINPNPGISLRASASYRREMVRVWGRYVLKDAFIRGYKS